MEVIYLKNKGEKSWGHLLKNAYNMKPFMGMNILPSSDFINWRWKTKFLGMIQGDENSIAKQAVDFIENSPNIYLYCDTYHFVGPNSNTYAQWVLDHFPDFKIHLPFNAFGKEYNIDIKSN